MRSASGRWGPKYEAIKLAAVGRKINEKTGKMAAHYKCASCSNTFVAKDVQADHIHPVVDIHDGFIDWNTYIKRMFCEVDGYQILCSGCHDVKTLSEREARKDKKHGKSENRN